MSIRTLIIVGIAAGLCGIWTGCEPPAAAPVASNVAPAPLAPPAPPPPPAVSPSPAFSEPIPSQPVDEVAEQPAKEVNQGASDFAAGPFAEFATPPAESAAEASAAAETQPPAEASSPTSASAASTSAGGQSLVSLSTGVALPQLLPEGTQIGVSVEYTVRGNLRTSSRYLLVVESGAGETPVEVKLSSQGGTLQGFLPLAVRPEHQPFRARIDEVPADGKRVKISNSAVLATSY